MGRPEKPIPDAMSAVGKLARALRDARQGVPYSVLSARTREYSASTLQRAASGRVVPKRAVARALAAACGRDVEEIDSLWLDAHRERRAPSRAREKAPRPHLVRTRPDLSAALEELWQKKGAPAYRLMERRARKSNLMLSRSTAQRICARRQVPGSAACLEAFLAGCGLRPQERGVWLEAWERLERQQMENANREHASELRMLETVVADAPSGRIGQDLACQLLRKAGFEALERYRGFQATWTVECHRCAAARRVRLCDVLFSEVVCFECSDVDERVRKGWAALLRGDVLVGDQMLRTLKKCTLLRVRQRRRYLEVQVYVPDRETKIVLQSGEWHAAFVAALGRHIRRSVSLEVLLIHDYAREEDQAA